MPEPTAVTIALEFQEQLAKNNNDFNLIMARRWLAVEAELKKLLDPLAEEIAKMNEAGEFVTREKLRQLTRYQTLMAQLQVQIQSFSDDAIPDIESENLDAQGLSIENAKELIVDQAQNRAIASQLNRLGVEPSQKIAALARAGQPLDEILMRAYPQAANMITDKLITANALGWNPRKTTEEILRNGGLDSALNHILLVARDQQIRNYREASRDTYRKSSVVYGYKRIAAKNSRTCMACLALDGTVWPTSKMMPLHPQDRCSMIPLVANRPVIDFPSGLSYFEKLPPGEQKKRLGATKYAMWKRGEFDLSQIVSFSESETWGTSTRITSIRELEKGRGGLPGNQTFTPDDLLALFRANRDR